MNFEEVGEQYNVLKAQYETGTISAQEFEASVRALVVLAPDGRKWYLDPFAGTWVELEVGKPPSISSKADVKAPETLIQFLSLMIKGLVKSIPRIILIGLLMSLLTWVAHTYIIAKINDGLMYNSAKVALNSVVHLQETHFRGVNAFWGLLAFFISSFFMRALSMGSQKWLNNIIQTPVNIKQSFKKSGNKALAALLIGAFIALFFISVYRNFMLSWVLAFGLLLIMTSHFQGVEITLLKLGFTDLQKLFNRCFVREGEEYDHIYLALLGLAGGFFLAGLLGTNFWVTFGFAFLSILAFVLLYVTGTPKIAALLALVGGGGALFLLDSTTVYAWCEGASLSQVGGSWIDWWGMNNADLVRRLGIIPALSSFLGGILGSAAAVIPGIPGMDSGAREGIPVIINLPMSPAGFGPPGDNPYTDFSGGDGPAGCSRFGLPNYWVNTATLNLVVQDTVFSSRGQGPPVNLTMTFNSGARTKGIFGWGWNFSYEWTLEENGSQIVVHKGSGQGLSYTVNTSGTPEQPSELLPPSGISHRLISYGDYWLYLEKGSRYFYRFDRVPGTSLARLTAIKDYYGQKVQLSYNDGGNIGSVTDVSGRVISFAYNEHNLCSAFTLPDGRQASFQYDGESRLVQAVDLLGVNSDYEYDGENYITKISVGRTRRTTTFSYCVKGGSKLVETVINANGNPTRYEMISMEPRQVRVTDPGGKATVYQSAAGLTEMIKDPAGHIVRYTYQEGRQVAFQDQNGQVAVREYDVNGNLLVETNPAGGKLSFSYDDADNLVQVNDPTGAEWRYRYDDKNNLVGITTPAGRNKSMVYNEQSLLVEITDFDGNKTEFVHDRYGNMIKAIDPLGHAISFTYDEYGYHKTSMTDQLGNTIAYQFDSNGRPLKYIYGDDSEKSIGYDCCYPILETDENGRNITNERDANGNIIRTFDQSGFSSEFGYDAGGNPVYFRDELGRTTHYAYDEVGHLLQATDPLGHRQVLAHDPAGNLLSLWVEGDRRTGFDYDWNDQLISVTDPLGFRVSLERDDLGRIRAINNARGSRITLSYNPDGLLTAKNYDGVETASFQYNEGGKISEVKDKTGSTSYAYDRLGRLEQISYPGGFELSYRYDAAGNLSTVNYPGGLTVEYVYDIRNRPVSMSWDGGYVKLFYDATGNLLGEERSNGTVSRYEYDDVGRMTKLSHGQGEMLFIERSYLRDAAGNILEEKGFQPVSPIPDSFINSGCNGADQLLGSEMGTFRYDADGNLVEAGERWSGSYDPENRLVELNHNGESCSYHYNGLSQRVQVMNGSGIRNYYYNRAGTLLFETDQTGRTVHYLTCRGRLIASVDSEGDSRFYHFDQAGNTLALTGEDGEVIAAYAYSPFGLRTELGAAGDNPFTYSGCFGVMSERNNLYFMKQRCYSADWVRFLQKDPLGIEGGVNLYAYAANNPLKYVDPEGTFVLEAYAVIKVLTIVGKTVGVVTTAVGVGTAAYHTGDSFYAQTQTPKLRENARNAWKDYRDGNYSTPQAEEAAYQRYVQSWNEFQNMNDRAWGGPERVTNTVIETTVELAIPDVAQVPYQTGKYIATKDSKCSFTESTSKGLRPNDRLTPQQKDDQRTIYGR